MSAARTLTCWPSTARTAHSNGSNAPITRSAGRERTRAREQRVAREMSADERGIRVRVEQPARARDNRHQRGHERRRDLDDDRVAALRRRIAICRPHRSSTSREGRCRRRTPPRPGPRAREGTRTRSGVERRAHVEDDPERLCLRLARGPGRRTSDGVIRWLARYASLNRRTLENPLANAISVIGSDVPSKSSRASAIRFESASSIGPTPSSSCIARRRWRAADAERQPRARRRSSRLSAPSSIFRAARRDEPRDRVDARRARARARAGSGSTRGSPRAPPAPRSGRTRNGRDPACARGRRAGSRCRSSSRRRRTLRRSGHRARRARGSRRRGRASRPLV